MNRSTWVRAKIELSIHLYLKKKNRTKKKKIKNTNILGQSNVIKKTRRIKKD